LEPPANPARFTSYLAEQAKKNPTSFMSLLGKVLPMQVTGSTEAPLDIRLNGNVASGMAAAIKALQDVRGA
jgi:hypothetical protein